MKVELISYTQHAKQLLLFVKGTRLELSPQRWEEIMFMKPDEIAREIKEIARTIPSSWEFLDVAFLITGVTRACAQQITRTRTGSYAMQSLRVVDAGEAGYRNDFAAGSRERDLFDAAALEAFKQYKNLLLWAPGEKEKARGLLPLNTNTNLVCKYNLRSFVDLVRSRESMRTQSEYAEVIAAMKEQVIMTWPWAEPFFTPLREASLEILREVVDELGLSVGSGAGWKIAKAMDLLRAEG